MMSYVKVSLVTTISKFILLISKFKRRSKKLTGTLYAAVRSNKVGTRAHNTKTDKEQDFPSTLVFFKHKIYMLIIKHYF